MGESRFGGLNFNRILKNDLNNIIKKDRDYFHALLRNIKYPNIVD